MWFHMKDIVYIFVIVIIVYHIITMFHIGNLMQMCLSDVCLSKRKGNLMSFSNLLSRNGRVMPTQVEVFFQRSTSF